MKAQRVEAKPKRVIKHSEFADECGVESHAKLRGQFLDLIDHFTNGWEIPDDFYRLKVDQDKDALLESTGVKHLHLDGRASNILVYLVETEDIVFILRIAGHAYLEDQPRGSALFERSRLPYPSPKK